MRVVDVRARAREAMVARGAAPGYYWALSGVGAAAVWVPVELDADGMLWQVGQNEACPLSALVQLGARLEPPRTCDKSKHPGYCSCPPEGRDR